MPPLRVVAPAVREKPARRRKLAPFAALGFAMTLFVTYALPAYSLLPGEVAGATTRAAIADPQSLSVASGGSVPIPRDNITIIDPPKPTHLPSAYAATARTFVNNPNSPIQWPFVHGVPLRDGFGYRTAPCSGCTTYHEGLDMDPGAGAPIQAIADGVVREVGNPSGSFGVYAIIDHIIDGQHVSSVYAHMEYGSLALAVGQPVTVGQAVGRVGSTGASTGAHLHVEIHIEGKPVDPYAWFVAHVQL
jgi:murein DD-endopeptidase MepM/ murein hydrolase activator NlpD